MKRVYSAANLIDAAHWANVLASHGIEAQLRNTTLGGGVGELPFVETWPQVWVADEQELHAKRVLEAVRAGAEGSAAAWRCERCGEQIDGQFDACWRCAEANP
ncbi:MAG TPA: DUF2007 domain-containing protein [Steroidobacteraceae bacterium]|nr:DUF2007 domain-containing protein [Steroidobacteraceae bacterium]